MVTLAKFNSTEPTSESDGEINSVDGLPSLIGLDRDELSQALVAIGVPEKQLRMRVSQLWQWMYLRGHATFDKMTNLGKDVRAKLAEHHSLTRPEIIEQQISEDGTRKWLFRFPSRGAGRPVEVETVYIPESDRGTLCISSQVGCTLTAHSAIRELKNSFAI